MSNHAPTSLDQVWPMLAGGGLSIVAGGTDLFPAMGDDPPPEAMLDISRISGLRGITLSGDIWRIGAATTWADLITADLPPAFDGLKAAAAEVGSVQIQNVATLAGNLCNASPAADGVPPLLTLQAEVELTSAHGQRRLALAEFITDVRKTARRPDELLTAIYIPAPPAPAGGSFVKLGSRRYLVISIAMAAAVIWLDRSGRVAGAHVAVGACSPVAKRLDALEQTLLGLDSGALASLSIPPSSLQPLSPIDDVRGSAAYRLDVVSALVRKALTIAAQSAGRADG